jgi:hypothetical protein
VTSLYRILLRTSVTRGRLLAFLAAGALLDLIAYAIRTSDYAHRELDVFQLLDVAALGLYAPVVALVFATSSLGDLASEGTLVYVWLRPVAAWRIVLVALAATRVTLARWLDGFALGRAKRILEAPDLLNHAAADPESWPKVETAVNASLNLLASRGAELAPEGSNRLKQALALCAAQGVLLAEWRQLEDGRTSWNGAAARIRASDAFSIERISEVMKRQLLPDLFAGISKRPANLELALLVPFTLATAFYLRLTGEPPKAFAA